MAKAPGLPVPIPQMVRPRVVAKLQITLIETGDVTVSGSCLGDMVATYGLLEMAKDAIRHHSHQEAASPLLLPPSARVRPLPPQETQRDVREEQEKDEAG